MLIEDELLQWAESQRNDQARNLMERAAAELVRLRQMVSKLGTELYPGKK